MTTDEIIAMAKEAGFGNYAYEAASTFGRFAALVAAKEREVCAAKIEAITYRRRWASASINGTPLAPCELATAIRAIGTP